MASLFAILFVLIVLPIGLLGLGSFLTEPPRAFRIDLTTLSLRNYIYILSDPGFLSLIGGTLSIALAGTVGAVIIGGSLAWITIRTDINRPELIGAVAIAPMFMPPLIGAFAWEILGSPRSGILNVVARSLGFEQFINIYSYAGIIFVFSYYYAPYVYLFVVSSLKNMDGALEEASAICGSGKIGTALKITFPLVIPSLLSSALLVFVLLIELFAIPAILAQPAGIKFVSVYIWELASSTPPQVGYASAHGMLLLTVAASFVVMQQRYLARKNFVVVGGKGRKIKRQQLGSVRYPIYALCLLYALLAVILPISALVFVALRDNLFFADAAQMLDLSMFSIDQVSFALTDSMVIRSLSNSAFVSLGAMSIGGALYFLVAHAIHRMKGPGRGALEVVSVLPVAIPGMVLGLGYVWTWISLPFGLYGTIWILIVAYVSQFTPQGVGAVSGSLRQIHPELEESSHLSGGGFWYTMRRVTLPLALPGLVSAMTLILVLSFRELAVSLFLYTSLTQVFSVTMFDYWSRGATATVAVMALVQIVILGLILGLGKLFGRFVVKE